MSSTFLSLIVPIYNETESIERFLLEFDNQRLYEYVNQIVFVDDGSNDGTWNMLGNMTGSRVDVTIIRHRSNQGLGGAIRTGVIHSRNDTVAWAPVDLEISLQDYRKLFAAFEPSETVFIRRLTTRKLRRDFVSKSAILIFFALFGYHLDGHTGSFLMPRHVFLNCQPITLRAISNLELIVRVLRSGTPITTVDVNIMRRSAGASRSFSFRSILRSLRELLGLILLDPSLLRCRRSHHIINK